MNAQKESLKKFPGFTQAPASPRKVCDENERKNDMCVKMLLMEEGVYRAPVEKQYDRLQRMPDRCN